MKSDDEVCLCFHVTFRKLINFMRRTPIQRPSQLSECFGAGTGCGWCRPVLERLAASDAKTLPDSETIDSWVEKNFAESIEIYAASRTTYRQQQNDR